MSVPGISPAMFIRVHILRMSNREFSEALKVCASAVTGYERLGQIPEHHYDTITKLAKDRRVVLKRGWFKAVPWDPSAGVPG